MVKFLHKKHIYKNPQTKSLVIYYNLSDIILGFLLVVLVAFFIFNYLKFSFQRPNITGIPVGVIRTSQYPVKQSTPK